LEIKVRMPVLY